MAQDIAEGTRFPTFFYGQSYMGALEAYVIAAVLPFFDDPVTALRFGPACFFAALVVIQYLMLTRWFGRRGGVMGVLVLLAAAPMIAQWSISARGGYIEVMLWGSALLWAYSEWFVPAGTGRSTIDGCSLTIPAPHSPLPTPLSSIVNPRHRFLFGVLIGSGLWINTSIALFILPIAVHALLDRPLTRLRESLRLGRWFERLAAQLGVGTLPMLAIAALLLLNLVWAVWATDGKVHKVFFLGLVSRPVGAGILGVAALIVVAAALRNARLVEMLRALMRANSLLILGALLGLMPSVLYAFQVAIGWRVLEPSLPMGVRPLWLGGETMLYLIEGLPLLFGADPRPFHELTWIGRDAVTVPLAPTFATLLAIADWLVFLAVPTVWAALLVSERKEIANLLRLQPRCHSPAVLLLLGAFGLLGLYVFGGCTYFFPSIRYLVPLWVFVPGIFAAVFAGRRMPRLVKLAVPCACLAWVVGQVAMVGQLGHPHSLRPLADTLVARGIDPAISEALDAHLLCYLTQQKCRVVEFEPTWPRLTHFRPLVESGGPTDYIVNTQQVDRTYDWTRGRWPGRPPPETQRILWPRLRLALIRNPDLLLSREPLVDGYERIRLRQPLPERKLPL